MSAQMTQVVSPKTDYEPLDKRAETETLPVGSVYGYVRASARDGAEDAQLAALRRAGVSEECIYTDTGFGLDAAQTEYAQLMRALRKNDVLVVASIDKLGTTYDEIIAQWQMLTKTKQVQVVVLDIPLLDTRLQRQQMGDSFIADLALQFMAYVATREREGIRQRQREGMLAAKARGVRFGRPPKPVPPQFDALLEQWRGKQISSRKAAQQLGVAQETFLRWARRRG